MRRANNALLALGHKRNKLDYYPTQGEDKVCYNSSNQQSQRSSYRTTDQRDDTMQHQNSTDEAAISKRRRIDDASSSAVEQRTISGKGSTITKVDDHCDSNIIEN